MSALRTLFLCLVVAAVAAGQASASTLLDRGASHPTLKVNGKGEALVEYAVHGKRRHLLVWGAVNANAPSKRPQVAFHVDYSGGWKKYGKVQYPNFDNHCGKYDGPELVDLVTACKASDGSYWALQGWQTDLPNFGFAPWLAKQRLVRLNLSHWTGELAKITAHTDWAYSGTVHEVFGQLTYRGKPVFGYHSTNRGVTLDAYGRNLALDTFNSAYGQGWKRENQFLTHNPNGNFCYRFNEHDVTSGGNTHPPGLGGKRPKGNGERYRLTVSGPGVTPDVSWEGDGLHDFEKTNPEDVALEQQMNLIEDGLSKSDRLCRQH